MLLLLGGLYVSDTCLSADLPIHSFSIICYIILICIIFLLNESNKRGLSLSLSLSLARLKSILFCFNS